MVLVNRSEMMPLLLQACPSFRPVWLSYAESQDFDAELEYIHLGEFARHLLSLIKQGDLFECSRPFSEPGIFEFCRIGY